MTKENKQIQANADDIINELSQQIAQLTAQNAVLNSIVKQYQENAE